MRHITRNFILTVVVLAVCLASIYPPKENLRLGKDLAGGVSLVYNVELGPDDPSDVMEKTIEVLKDRVNPRGLFEIDFRKQGRDQIEITMPLPNEEVKALRRAYDAELAKLHDYEIDVDAFEQAMRQTGEARETALRAMGDTPARKALLQPVADALKAAREAREAYDAARGEAAIPEEEKARLLEAAGAAEVALDAARQRLLASLITVDDVRAKLELSAQGAKIRDTKKGEVKSMPSPREKALAGVRERLQAVPDGPALLDSIIAKHDAFAKKRKGLDDPADLQRLLQGAGVLTFRIGVGQGELGADEQRLRQELKTRGAEYVQSDKARWFPINKLESFYDSVEQFDALSANPSAYFASRSGLIAEEHDGQVYVLLYDQPGLRLTKAEGDWSLVDAGPSTDRLGRPCIHFRTDVVGGRLLGDLTGNNINRQMAILLDDRLYTSANINSRIPGEGVIEGSFTTEEINYVVKTMAAGSLQAKLGERPISVSTQGPELGKDNLDRGLRACILSFVIVGAFMVCYYFLPGVVAVLGMVTVAIMVLGAMALQQAAFTLPGIAGIALTFGMAVDANVLIYERLREELRHGRDLRSALRLSYERAGAAIIDSNITTLITTVILGYTGTPEVKGFAIALGIGVCATMFMALIITRLILVVMVERLNIEAMRFSLPLAIPALQRMLEPNVRWLSLRHVFWLCSAGLVAMSLGLMWHQGAAMLDSEFRGGTSVTINFVEPARSPGAARPPLKLQRKEVQARVEAMAKADPELKELLNADILPLNADEDGVTSSTFLVRSTISDSEKIGQAIVSAFQDVIETTPALRFAHSEQEEPNEAIVRPIFEPTLGPNIGRDAVRNSVQKFVGGAAIVLDGLDQNTPPPTRDELVRRLENVRKQAAFAAAAKRDSQLIVIDGTSDAVKTAVLVVSDPRVSAYDAAKWRTELAATEWALVRESLARASTLAGVQSFSPQIAQSFRAQAIVAAILSFLGISIYVWVRFGSPRFAAAALVPLVHDVIIALGFIALAEVLYEKFPGVAAIGIRPYKLDMGLVAAVMTIIGYSLNDTIIVLDRIRENRGKLAYASKQVVENSINQTMSRTFITSGTTFISLVVILIYGGEAVASFAYALTVGVLIGTYSSFAIAAPFVWTRHPPAAGATLLHTPDAEAEPKANALVAT